MPRTVVKDFMLKMFSRLKRYIYDMRLFLAIFFVLAIALKFFPQIDLYISGLFYDGPERFYMADKPLTMAVYYGVNYVTTAVIVVFSLLLIAFVVTRREFFGIKRKALAFLILAMILAPGIIVNGLLKEEVGRPRPDAVIEFGGTAKFVGPFTISNECDGNCSFVSGHASLGFYFMAFGLVAAGLLRRRLVAFGFAAGALIGLVRVIQGRHFFSDVVFAFFFVWLTITLLYALMYGPEDVNSVKDVHSSAE